MSFDNAIVLFIKLIGFAACVCGAIAVCWQALFWLWSGVWVSLDVVHATSLVYSWFGEQSPIDQPLTWIGFHRLLTWTPAPLVGIVAGYALIKFE